MILVILKFHKLKRAGFCAQCGTLKKIDVWHLHRHLHHKFIQRSMLVRGTTCMNEKRFGKACVDGSTDEKVSSGRSQSSCGRRAANWAKQNQVQELQGSGHSSTTLRVQSAVLRFLILLEKVRKVKGCVNCLALFLLFVHSEKVAISTSVFNQVSQFSAIISKTDVRFPTNKGQPTHMHETKVMKLNFQLRLSSNQNWVCSTKGKTNLVCSLCTGKS